MAHSHHLHREHQVSHRRVHHILKQEPEGAMQHSHSHAFSKVTSKSAAQEHDGKTAGKKMPKRFARGGHVKHSDVTEDKKLIKKMLAEHEKKERAEGYARGGKVKHGHQTNIAIVVPHRGAQQPMAGSPGAMAGGPPPGGPPMGPPPGAGGPPGLPPGMPPPGMPMRARGGKVLDGESTEKDLKGWSHYASKNSYFRGGAATGVGREEKAEHQKHKKHR